MQIDETIQKIVSTKGKPLIIGEHLDKNVREYWLETRCRGGPVNTAVAITTGTGIVMSHDPSLLVGDNFNQGLGKVFVELDRVCKEEMPKFLAKMCYIRTYNIGLKLYSLFP